MRDKAEAVQIKCPTCDHTQIIYIPKEEITEIAEYLVDVLTAKKEGRNPWETWEEKLPTSYFERRWGAAWKDNDQNFWDTFKASLKSRKK